MFKSYFYQQMEFVWQKVVIFQNNKTMKTLMQHFQEVGIIAFIFKDVFERNGFAVDVICAAGFERVFGYHEKNLDGEGIVGMRGEASDVDNFVLL